MCELPKATHLVRKPHPRLVTWYPLCCTTSAQETMGTQTNCQTKQSADFKWIRPGLAELIGQSLERSLDSKITRETDLPWRLACRYARKFRGNRPKYTSPSTGLTPAGNGGLRNSALLLLNWTQWISQGARECLTAPATSAFSVPSPGLEPSAKARRSNTQPELQEAVCPIQKTLVAAH